MNAKKILIASIAIISLSAVTSCDWLFKKNVHTNPLAGKWYLDSINTSSVDSSNVLALLALVLTKKDSSKMVYEFDKDSTAYFYLTAKEKNTDSSKAFYYFQSDSTFLLKELNDSLPQTWNFHIKDSALTLISHDKLQLNLSRK